MILKIWVICCPILSKQFENKYFLQKLGETRRTAGVFGGFCLLPKAGKEWYDTKHEYTNDHN